MLVLTAKDIQYCKLSEARAYPEKTYPGIFYRGIIFVQIASFANNQIKQAQSLCRQFLEREDPVTTVIVKETECITLWSEASKINLIVPEIEQIFPVDIKIKNQLTTTLQKTSLESKRKEKFNLNSSINWNQSRIILASLIFTVFTVLFVKLGAASKITQQEEKVVATKQTVRNFKQIDLEIPQGVFNYGGSTVWEPIRRKIDKKITSEIPQFKLRYRSHPIWNSSSSVGINMLIENKISIAQSSRPLSSLEIKQAKENGIELKQIAVAIDGIAIATHPDLEITGLTIDLLRKIYLGKITNWKEVGGPNLEIVPYSKSPHASGTASHFTKIILDREYIDTNVKLTTSTSEALKIVATNRGAIFYESATEIIPECSVKAISIGSDARNLISPYQEIPKSSKDCLTKAHTVNNKSFQDGSYPLTNTLYVIIKQNGQIEEAAGLAYAQLLLTEAGQKALSEAGFVPIR